MATLIPALTTCVARMTAGEQRLAERLEHKLDDDYLIWYDVPVGPHRSQPDFIVLHPQRGLLVLEVRDWRLDTIRHAGELIWEIATGGERHNEINPMEHVRHHAHQVVDALSKDVKLVIQAGKWQGMLSFPWSYGVVLTHITRRQFDLFQLGAILEPHRVICSDEMTESVDADTLQGRLWGMFPVLMRGTLTMQQIDRLRWILFPEIRVGEEARQQSGVDLNYGPDDIPESLKVMDLHQEQLARSLGDGHRVIHGVAGSGKTMILGYRAEHLAKSVTTQPVLVLCYSEPLAVKLASVMAARGLAGKVLVQHFQAWCRTQLAMWGQPVPEGLSGNAETLHAMVGQLMHAVDTRQVPSAQYLAVLIDEGHDFEPEWLRIAAQMVDPAHNHLLLLYDDAQRMQRRPGARSFSFRSVGIQAQGRTTVLRLNYRNSRQVLRTASRVAGNLLTASRKGSGDGQRDHGGTALGASRNDDAIPLIQPVSSGREGHEPIVLRLPDLRGEAVQVAQLLRVAHDQGHPWREMAVICSSRAVMEECARELRDRMLPHQLRTITGTFEPEADTIKVMTMHASKGLEFGVVALMGVGEMTLTGATDDQRLFYVGATRSTDRLFITISGEAPNQLFDHAG